MKTKLKALIALSLFILLMFSLSLVALAGTANRNNSLYSVHEESLAPDGIGLLMTTFNVNTTTDELTTNGFCSLREAIEAANGDITVADCGTGSGNDLINVPAGTYGLFLSTGGDLSTNGDLDITSTLTISGAGAGLTIIDDNVQQRVFDIHNSGVATITGVTITSGQDKTGDGGGGIKNEGTLVLIESTVSGNTTTTDGGGIFNDGTGSSVGNLTLIDSTIRSNAASLSGGGIFNRNGTVTINSSTISLNSANADSEFGVGGGIANSADGLNATVTINESFITTNTVKGVGGGGINNSAFSNRTATVSLSKTLVSGNIATATTVSIDSGFGGGIRNGFIDKASGTATSILTLNNSTVSDNTAYNGGGIGSGTTLPTTTLTLEVTLNNSTVSGNKANGLTSADVVGNGGGIVNQNGNMNLVNSTVSDNEAKGGTGTVRGYGGGIANSGFAIGTTVALSNSTISNNTAISAGNALANLHLGAGTETIFRNTIITGGCANPTLVVQPGTLTSNGYNMDDGNTCDFTDPTDFINTNPMLGSLQNNGGDTETHALPSLPSPSPAIDAGICSGAPTTDQRNETRPNAVSAFCDIGAYESSSLGLADLEITKVVTPTQADPGQAITYTLTFTSSGPAWAGNVVITDIVPLTVTGVASTNSGVAITATSGVTYSWTLGNLARGSSGVITITGLINPGVLSGTSFINTALITNVNDNDNDSATVAIGESGAILYLPIIMKNSS